MLSKHIDLPEVKQIFKNDTKIHTTGIYEGNSQQHYVNGKLYGYSFKIETRFDRFHNTYITKYKYVFNNGVIQ